MKKFHYCNTQLIKNLGQTHDPSYIKLIAHFNHIFGEWSAFLEIASIQVIHTPKRAERVLTLACYAKTPFECQFQSAFLIQKIQDALGFAYIHKLRFITRSQNAKKHLGTSSKIPKPANLDEALLRLEEAYRNRVV